MFLDLVVGEGEAAGVGAVCYVQTSREMLRFLCESSNVAKVRALVQSITIMRMAAVPILGMVFPGSRSKILWVTPVGTG